MIKTNLDTITKNKTIVNALPDIYKFICELEKFEVGQVRINENILANFLEYNTNQRDSRVWEAHKKDYDVHFMYCGEEQTDLGDSTKMEKEEYCEEDDYYLLHGMEEDTIILKTEEILILNPDEAHRTGIGEANNKVQKIVFKIRML